MLTDQGRLTTYILAVSSVKLAEVWPVDIPLNSVQQRFPHLRAIHFTTPVGQVSGKIFRNQAQEMVNMSVKISKLLRISTSAAPLSSSHFGLAGDTAQFRLIQFDIGQHPGIQRGVRKHSPLLSIHPNYEESEEPLSEAVVQVLRHLEVLQAFDARVTIDEFKKLLAHTPRLRILAIAVIFGGENKTVEDDLVISRAGKALLKSCPDLRQLYFKWHGYGFHNDAKALLDTLHPRVRSVVLDTSLQRETALAKAQPISDVLRAAPSRLSGIARKFAWMDNLDMIYFPLDEPLLDPSVFAYTLLETFGRKCHINLWVEGKRCSPDEAAGRHMWCRYVLNFRAALIHRIFSPSPGFRHIKKAVTKPRDVRRRSSALSFSGYRVGSHSRPINPLPKRAAQSTTGEASGAVVEPTTISGGGKEPFTAPTAGANVDVNMQIISEEGDTSGNAQAQPEQSENPPGVEVKEAEDGGDDDEDEDDSSTCFSSIIGSASRNSVTSPPSTFGDSRSSTPTPSNPAFTPVCTSSPRTPSPPTSTTAGRAALSSGETSATSSTSTSSSSTRPYPSPTPSHSRSSSTRTSPTTLESA